MCPGLAELRSQLARVSAGQCLKFWHCLCEPGIKIDGNNISEQGLLPDIRCLFKDDFPFQQDGAPAHPSLHTITYLHFHVPEFTELENWLPNTGLLSVELSNR